MAKLSLVWLISSRDFFRGGSLGLIMTLDALQFFFCYVCFTSHRSLTHYYVFLDVWLFINFMQLKPFEMSAWNFPSETHWWTTGQFHFQMMTDDVITAADQSAVSRQLAVNRTLIMNTQNLFFSFSFFSWLSVFVFMLQKFRTLEFFSCPKLDHV